MFRGLELEASKEILYSRPGCSIKFLSCFLASAPPNHVLKLSSAHVGDTLKYCYTSLSYILVTYTSSTAYISVLCLSTCVTIYKLCLIAAITSDGD